jgi:putative NIF3 family GTP cyclohydrolase 1 type 2
VNDTFHAIHESPRETVGQLAKHVLEQTRALGQQSVQLLGDPDTPVRHVGIGCGAITQLPVLAHLGADVVVASDDGLRHWSEGAWALDAGLPVVIVNHATSEEPGMRSLEQYLSHQFADVPTHFLPQGCMTRAIG